jgi:predicted ferric reductase
MSESNTLEVVFWGLAAALLVLIVGAVVAVTVLIPGSPLVAISRWILDTLFAASSVQALWYVTRAAGLVAYFLLWLSTAWGLAVSSKIFDPLLHRAFTYDMHQFISLLAIGFTILHVVVLLGDRYLPFSVAQILIPFIAPYRPLWVGVGVIGLYVTLLVSATFYIRRWIGQKTFRVIHVSSFLAYAAVTMHGLMAGTDSPLWTTQLMYAGTALAIIFLTVYWIATVLQNRLSAPIVRNNIVDSRG